MEKHLAQLDLNSIENVGLPGLKKEFMFGLGPLISAFLPYIFAASGIGLLIYLMLGGLQLMTSKGDPKAIQAAQGKITSALIGFIIVVIAFVIVRLFGQILGIDAFSNLFS